MKLQFWSIGKSHEPFIRQGVENFTKRISNYYPVEWRIIPVPKNAILLKEADKKKKEGQIILDGLSSEDYFVVLEETGTQLSSTGLAEFIQRRVNERVKNIVFLVGGAYGVDETVLKRANFKWSLSKLVFPHQLVRLILAEQVYRACTILRNEKYHHS